MSLVDAVNENWGWSGVSVTRVRAQSPMGHLVLSDAEDQFFYLDPDGMAIIPLGTRDEAQEHLDGEEAKELWFGGELLAKGRELLGEPPEGSVITLKPDALVEGRYTPENLWILPLEELIHFSGSIARQIKDLPDGSQIQIETVD